MVGDVRLSRRDGDSWVPITSLGFRKVHVFSGRTVCGFSGEVNRAWNAMVGVRASTEANGGDEPRLVDQVKGWVNELFRRDDPLVERGQDRTDLLLLRTLLDKATGVLLTSGVRVSLLWFEDEKPHVRVFILIEHIGSGSEIPACREAIEQNRQSILGLGGFEQAAPGKGLPARIMGRELSNVIAKSADSSVSPDVDICILSFQGAWFGGIRRSRPPVHVCETLEELREHLDEGVGVAIQA